MGEGIIFKDALEAGGGGGSLPAAVLEALLLFGVSGPCDVRSGTPCQAGFGGELWAKRKRKASSHQYLKG